MIIYSEKTKQQYETVEQCLAAETEFDEAKRQEEVKKEEMKKLKQARAQEIADAYQGLLEIKEHFYKMVRDYEKEFGKAQFSFQFGGTKVFPWF